MIYIRQIMQVLNVDESTAYKVFENMYIDLSESTDKQIVAAIHSAFAELNTEN